MIFWLHQNRRTESEEYYDGKLNIIIFSFLPKTGSVGPVEQQIKLVSPNIINLQGEISIDDGCS